MSAIKHVFILLVVIAAAAGCWATEKTAAREKTDEQIIVEGNNSFALDLYAKIRPDYICPKKAIGVADKDRLLS